MHHTNRHVALASMNMTVFKTRLLVKPLVTLFFLPLCDLATFELTGSGRRKLVNNAATNDANDVILL